MSDQLRQLTFAFASANAHAAHALQLAEKYMQLDSITKLAFMTFVPTIVAETIGILNFSLHTYQTSLGNVGSDISAELMTSYEIKILAADSINFQTKLILAQQAFTTPS